MDKYNLQQPPNNITFCDTSKGYQREVLRITKDGITANPDVPVDDAAAAVIRALDGYIKNLTQRTWVELMDDEIDTEAFKDDHAAYFALGAIWANKKLREKNG